MIEIYALRKPAAFLFAIGIITVTLFLGTHAWAQAKAERTFTAVVTDMQGIETEVKRVIYYWEEKISETAFVPHELKEVPVKRGASIVKVKFETIKQIEIKTGDDPKALPSLTITLSNGKTGDFALANAGSFKGDSDFGEVELPANTLKKVVFK